MSLPAARATRNRTVPRTIRFEFPHDAALLVDQQFRVTDHVHRKDVANLQFVFRVALGGSALEATKPGKQLRTLHAAPVTAGWQADLTVAFNVWLGGTSSLALAVVRQPPDEGGSHPIRFMANKCDGRTPLQGVEQPPLSGTLWHSAFVSIVQVDPCLDIAARFPIPSASLFPAIPRCSRRASRALAINPFQTTILFGGWPSACSKTPFQNLFVGAAFQGSLTSSS